MVIVQIPYCAKQQDICNNMMSIEMVEKQDIKQIV